MREQQLPIHNQTIHAYVKQNDTEDDIKGVKQCMVACDIGPNNLIIV